MLVIKLVFAIGLLHLCCVTGPNNRDIEATIISALLSVNEDGFTVDNLPGIGFMISISNKGTKDIYIPFDDRKSDFSTVFECGIDKTRLNLYNPSAQNILVKSNSETRIFLETFPEEIELTKRKCKYESLHEFLLEIAQKSHISYRSTVDSIISKEGREYSSLIGINVLERSLNFDIKYSGS